TLKYPVTHPYSHSCALSLNITATHALTDTPTMQPLTHPQTHSCAHSVTNTDTHIPSHSSI
ncbi:hypothetical protein NDU88_000092, partial [Pleurodeles waltl]